MRCQFVAACDSLGLTRRRSEGWLQKASSGGQRPPRFPGGRYSKDVIQRICHVFIMCVNVLLNIDINSIDINIEQY